MPQPDYAGAMPLTLLAIGETMAMVTPVVATPVSDADAKNLFPNGWKTVKPYLRVVPQPK